jgi:prepilin-type N-terminal cleavage/methylation domain-containing protein
MEKAFTLIELLVVIAIVGILAGLAVVNMSGATEAARIAKLKVFADSVNNSLLGNRVSEWKLDEGTGTTTADTVGANGGILANFNFDSTDGWRSSSSCVSGGCLQFDGTNDYVNCGNLGAMPSQGTLSFWMNPSVVESYRNPFATVYNGSNAGIRFEENNVGTFGAIVGNDIGTYTAGNYLDAGLQANRWYHVVLVWDQTTNNMKGYLDGANKFNKANTYWATTMPAVAIGNGYSSARFWKGFIDEVRIYNAVMTASAVREQYVAGLDKLLASNQITEQDYQQRLADLNLTYAVKE